MMKLSENEDRLRHTRAITRDNKKKTLSWGSATRTGESATFCSAAQARDDRDLSASPGRQEARN